MGKFTAEEWRRIFRAVVEYCSKHKDEEGGYRECRKKYLREASREGKLPSKIAKIA